MRWICPRETARVISGQTTMNELDPVIHPLNRFKICAVLNAAGALEGAINKEMRFAAIRDKVNQSSALSCLDSVASD